MEIGVEEHRLADQEDLGDLEVVAERVAVGDRDQGRDRRDRDRKHQQAVDDPLESRRGPPFRPSRPGRERVPGQPQAGEQPDLGGDRDQDRQSGEVQLAELADRQASQCHQPQSQRGRLRQGVERMLGKLADAPQHPLADPGRDDRQEECEPKVYHASPVLSRVGANQA